MNINDIPNKNQVFCLQMQKWQMLQFSGNLFSNQSFFSYNNFSMVFNSYFMCITLISISNVNGPKSTKEFIQSGVNIHTRKCSPTKTWKLFITLIFAGCKFNVKQV